MNEWIKIGNYKWTKACVELCLKYECKGDSNKLSEMLLKFYYQYKHSA